jgi:hypothetical protein
MIQWMFSMAWLMAAGTSDPARGITREEFLKMNGIDPGAPAFVRVDKVELPAGCERDSVDAFVKKNWRAWSSLHGQDLLGENPAGADGASQVELVIEQGKPLRSTLSNDSVGSSALMERLQADFATLRFSQE